MLRVIREICLPCEMRSLFLRGEICGLKPNHLTYLSFIYIKSHYNGMKKELIKRLHPSKHKILYKYRSH